MYIFVRTMYVQFAHGTDIVLSLIPVPVCLGLAPVVPRTCRSVGLYSTYCPLFLSVFCPALLSPCPCMSLAYLPYFPLTLSVCDGPPSLFSVPACLWPLSFLSPTLFFLFPCLNVPYSCPVLTKPCPSLSLVLSLLSLIRACFCRVLVFGPVFFPLSLSVFCPILTNPYQSLSLVLSLLYPFIAFLLPCLHYPLSTFTLALSLLSPILACFMPCVYLCPCPCFLLF
jgi:hypothetical protein